MYFNYPSNWYDSLVYALLTLTTLVGLPVLDNLIKWLNGKCWSTIVGGPWSGPSFINQWMHINVIGYCGIVFPMDICWSWRFLLKELRTGYLFNATFSFHSFLLHHTKMAPTKRRSGSSRNCTWCKFFKQNTLLVQSCIKKKDTKTNCITSKNYQMQIMKHENTMLMQEV